ncbi:MAG TPA: MFS transporter [Opitutaceae bacterium]|nr:MFS transporter [Opitutaceae bacterium]
MDKATRQALRAFPRAMWVLAAGNFVNRFGGFVVPLLALHLTHLGFSAERIGIVLGAYGVGRLGASVLGGNWTDRHGHRFVIALSMFSSAAGMLVLGWLTDYHAILAMVLFQGLASELFRPASSALIAELSPPEHRLVAFALNRLAVNAGFALGPAVGGILATFSFHWIFVGNAVADLAYGVLAWRGLPARLRHPTASGADSGTWSAVLADRRLLLFLASIFPMTFIFMQGSSSFALYTADLGFSPRDFGLLLGINGLLIVTCELTLTGFTRRFSAIQVLTLGYTLLGVGYALTGLAHHFATLAITVVIWTCGEMISAPTQSAVLADMAPAHLRGRYMAAATLMWSLATIVGPSLGSLLYGWSPTALWLFSAMMGLASAAAVRVALRRPRAAVLDRANGRS